MKEGDKYIDCIFSIFPEEGGWVSICRELDVALCGDTFDEAADNVMDALAMHMRVN